MEKINLDKLGPGKTIALAVLFSALIFGILYANGSLYKNSTAQTGVVKETTNGLEENAPVLEYIIIVEEPGTVAEQLFEYAKKNNIDIKYKDYGPDMGIFVQSIAGVPEDINTKTDKWWQFWVNGKYSNKGASSVEVKEGDEIIWRYAPANY